MRKRAVADTRRQLAHHIWGWVLLAVLLWTSVTTFMVWMPTMRALMDGPTFHWQAAPRVSGDGVTADYPVLVLATALVMAIAYFGWRGARPPFHWLLLMWQFPLASFVLGTSIEHPADMRLRDATFGLDVQLHWIVPTAFILFGLASWIWVVYELNSPLELIEPTWTRANRLILAGSVILFPFEFVALRLGHPGGNLDRFGVVLLAVQWLMFNIGLMPWSARRTARSREARR
jgi:hypothetical protein